jgi:hypothetical protein
VHADERGRVQKTVLRQLKYELIKIFRRHAKFIKAAWMAPETFASRSRS